MAARRDRAGVALLAGVAFVLTLVATRSGPGVSPDSVSYLAAARSAGQGLGLRDYDGAPFTHWPPGFPALLGIFDALGISGLDASRYLNAVAYVAIVVLSFVLLEKHVRAPGYARFGTAVVAVSPPLLRTADMVWSEPLFTVLLLLFVLTLERACEGENVGGYAVAGLVASGAVLVRYLGFALLVAGGATILVLFARRGAKFVIARAAWFAVCALAGPALWGARNLAHSQPALGAQATGSRSLTDAVEELVLGIGGLSVPQGVPTVVTLVAGAGIIVIVGVATAIALRAAPNSTMVPLTLVVSLGFLFALVSMRLAGSDASARILAPYFPLLVVIALFLFERWRARAVDGGARRAVMAVMMLGVLGLGLFTAWSLALAYDHGRDGQQYAAASWADSALIAEVAPLPAGASVYSNDALAISFLDGRERVGSVVSEPDPIRASSATRSEIRRQACSGRVYVAWFGPDDSRLRGRTREVEDGTLVTVSCQR